MTQFSAPFPQVGPGDGRLYLDSEWRLIWGALFTRGFSASRGVLLDYAGELEVTVAGANSLNVAAGGAVCKGSVLISDAVVNLTPTSAPGGSSRSDSVIVAMHLTTAAQYTTRVTYKAGAFGAPPAMTQDANTWEIRLYNYVIDDAGAITGLSDQRQYCRFAGSEDHGDLDGLGDDDHAQYYNAARHTKAVHDALNINADTVDGYHAASLVASTVFLGMMVMWGGALGGSDGHRPIVGGVALETWHLSNGQTVNGIVTLNMVNWFPFGAGDWAAVDASGGAATVNSSHTHGNTGAEASHTHTNALSMSYNFSDTLGSRQAVTDVTTPSFGGSSHLHSTASGGSATLAIIPPFRAVYFITYVG
jgi:hypothetical protein